jgi:GNAT superfamily N-acetyltransferase
MSRERRANHAGVPACGVRAGLRIPIPDAGGIIAPTRSVSAEQPSLTAQRWPELYSRPSKTMRRSRRRAGPRPLWRRSTRRGTNRSPTRTCIALSRKPKARSSARSRLLPATQALHPNHEPTLGHIRNFFVTRDFWGTGLAEDLHRAALDAARERGFSELRLFVPAGQARARRFYERVSWLPIGNPFDDPISGFTMVEYRYRLLRTETQRVRRVGALRPGGGSDHNAPRAAATRRPA